MFHKPFRVKTQTAIKGSDRKKLRAEIAKQFPNFPAELLNDVVPSKEEMTVAKIYTHSGDNTVVYCLQKNPIFFEKDRIVFPTVYTLWRFPELLPTFTTWPPVFKKLAGGADLMLPGVVVGGEVTPRTYAHFQKGDVCAVNLMGNRAPVAVGITAMSGSDMFDSAMRGKGVHPLHMFGDELWAFGEKTSPPDLGIDGMPIYTDEHSEDAGATPEEAESEADADAVPDTATNSGTENYQDCEQDGLVGSEELPNMDELAIAEPTENLESAEQLADTKLSAAFSEDLCESQNEAVSENAQGSDDVKSCVEEIDDTLYMCFLCALKKSVKESDLPLLTSAFFRSHMVPYCPSDKTLDVKKSSYKKLSRFLQSMEDQGFIQVKELSRGVDSIVDLNKDHPEVKNFAVPERDKETEVASASGGAEYQPPQITEMFAVPTPLLSVFKDFGYRKGDALTAADVRNVIKEYAKANDLQGDEHKSRVQLDPVLAHIVLNKGEGDVTTMAWQDLLTRITGKMQIVHQITFPGQPPMIRKGKVESIKLDVLQRASNKKVTIVDNLEMFGIDPQEFAHTVQVSMACSSSINPSPQKNKGMQVLVQGNQISFIANLLLDKYKIGRKHIQGLEKAPKTKRR